MRPDDTVGFAHPAFREVVYDGLLPTERHALHGRAAEALEAAVERGDLDRGDVAAELARHWLRADDLERALDSSVTAGLAAREMYAFEDARANFARAAELSTRVDSDHDRAWLLGEAAQAAHLTGDSDEAIRLATSALEITDDPAARASLCERLGAFNYLAGHGEDAEQWLHRALDLLPDGAADELSARVHAGLALFAAAWSRMDEAEQWSTAGLTVARRCGARREEGLLLNALGSVLAPPGRPRRRHRAPPGGARDRRRLGGPDDLALPTSTSRHVLGLAGTARRGGRHQPGRPAKSSAGSG